MSDWGLYASATEHRRYSEPLPTTSRKRCSCCRRRATHRGMANGLALMRGCDLRVRRWVRDGYEPSSLMKFEPGPRAA